MCCCHSISICGTWGIKWMVEYIQYKVHFTLSYTWWIQIYFQQMCICMNLSLNYRKLELLWIIFCRKTENLKTIVNYFSVGVKSKMVTIFYCIVVFISLLLIFWWLCINCPFCSDIAIDDLKSENKISLFNEIYLCWNIIYCHLLSSSDYSTQFSTFKYHSCKLKKKE